MANKVKKPFVEIISFGFKYGKPFSNFTFDVSFLKNPKLKDKWSENIWHLTPDMKDFVLQQEKAQEFIRLVVPFIRYVAKQTDCVIGIGCTGGHHRSVSVCEEIKDILSDEFEVRLINRDDKR